MKFVLAFLAIFLLATTFASHASSRLANRVAASEAATREAAASLRRLSTSKLGKTLLDTLQLELRSHTYDDDPRPRLLRLLNEIEDETQQQLISLTNHITDVRQACHDAQEQYEDNIDNLEEDISSLNSQQTALQTDLDASNEQLEAKNGVVESLTAQQAEFTAIRNSQAADFAKDQTKFGNLVSVLEQTRAFIYDRLQQRGSSFLQKNNILVEIKRRVMTPEFQATTPGWSKFISFLATKALEKLRQSPDDDAAVNDLSNIINVIDDVRERLTVANADSVALEAARQAAYDSSNSDLQSQIDTNNGDIAALQGQITADQNQIAANAARLANDDSDLDDNQDALQQSLADCQAADDQYSEQFQQAQDEAEIIQEVIDIVQNQLTNLRSAVETAVANL